MLSFLTKRLEMGFQEDKVVDRVLTTSSKSWEGNNVKVKLDRVRKNTRNVGSFENSAAILLLKFI